MSCASSPKHDGDNGDKIDDDDPDYIADYLVGNRDSYFNWIGGEGGYSFSMAGGRATQERTAAGTVSGKSTAVPITIKGIPSGGAGLGAYLLRLRFDPGVVTVEDIVVSDGAFTGKPVFRIDSAKGEVIMTGIHPQMSGVTGDVTLAYAIIRAVKDSGSSSTLDVEVIDLASSSGNGTMVEEIAGTAVIVQ